MSISPHRTPEFQRLRRELIGIELDYTLLKTGLLLRKFNVDQPRVPAGDRSGGQWIGDNHRVRDAAAEAAVTQPAYLPPTHPAVIAVEAAITLYTYLSTRNGPDQQAVLEVNSKLFEPDVSGGFDPQSVRTLTTTEVQSICPRLADVQERTDRLTKQVDRRFPLLNAAVRGTAVHTTLKYEINGLGDPNYRGEVSFLKGIEDNYGLKGSIRIDVLERVDAQTVCVYDIKTGRSALNLARTLEIEGTVRKAFGNTSRIIVTEVRPRR